jgi:selenocysteine lyase/cysteine desulfurase
MQEARAALVDDLNTNPNDIVFATNTTTAVNMIAHSLQLSSAEELL